MRKQRQIGSLSTVLVFLAAGLQAGAAEPDHPSPCSDPWYGYIDKLVVTGDGAGHGPDVGSDEWKSVIEFKLGVRGDPKVPERSSTAWCEFIDTLASKKGK